MNDRESHRIIIGGGGTGGHVFPAISIANALKDMDPAMKILFVGAKNRMEMEKVPEAGYEIIGLPVTGYQRRFTFKNVAFFFRLLISMYQSNKIIRDFKPDVAVGVGGYASGPILKAAVRHKIPILLQEQNSYAGVTNRLLAKFARKICVAYEGMEKYFPADRIVLTGNPVRQELKNISQCRQTDVTFFGLEPGKNTILIIGGSLGARTLNNCIREGLSRFDRNDLQVIWQTGKGDYEIAKEAVDISGLNNIKVLSFISEMNRAFA
ncbi:MAG TPA: UDP-N-acetylglucosamine--N-acetylmuramyl-(pentapeptide) pyrophosphoryl-undecaprenol N-acetylglucosamine transferase, partial [Bacteroidaceae bacterium]|nr:UDP-N-acetylglucosamine--N-acetylmuramyl-(pentapeptide) pyrophosphoryl-undecaprenol N-acetylglucosamine transferase [Bacteroidaceae bacterium]